MSSIPPKASRQPRAQATYSQIFGEWLSTWPRRSALVAITRRCRSLRHVKYRAVSQRYFDVGIADQHAVTFAAASPARHAAGPGHHSTFCSAATTSMIHDVAIQNLPVVEHRRRHRRPIATTIAETWALRK